LRRCGVFGFLLFLAQFEHVRNVRARHEAYPGIVCHHEIPGIDAHSANLNLAVDLDGLEPPFSGDRRDLAGPDRIIDHARMAHIADATHDDGAALALTLSGDRRNATHVRHAGDAEITNTSSSSARLWASSSAMRLT
jgi:hypothetical protein